MVRPRQVSDAQILDAARSVFLEHGPIAPTSLVAERLGVSPAALFKRFGSKEDLLCAALAPQPPAWVKRLEAGPGEGDVRAALREVALEISACFEQLVPAVAMLAASGISPQRVATHHGPVPPPLQGQRALAGWLARAQAQGKLGEGDPTTMAFSLLGALHLRAFLRHVAREHTDPRSSTIFVEELLASLWHGFAPDAAAAHPQARRESAGPGRGRPRPSGKAR